MSTDSSAAADHQVRIIHLEDDLHDRELVAAMLFAHGVHCEIIYAYDRDTFRTVLEKEEADLIISDFSLPGYDGVRALEIAQQMRKEIPFIFFSGTLGEEAAIESLKSGATDYVLKQRPERLIVAVRRALTEASERIFRRRMAEELRRSDTLLRQIMENIEDLVAVLDLQGRFHLISPSYGRLFGTNTPVIGADFLAFTHPDDRAQISEAYQRTMVAGTSQRVEYRLLLPNEEVRIIEAQGSVMSNEAGQAEFVLWVSRDITERRIAEEQILEQAALLDEARDAICVNDLDQRILFWNRSAERLYGWPANEAIGRNANELLCQGGVALAALKTLIQRGEWLGELQQTTRSGQQLVVESRWTLIRDAKDVPKSILVINTDVTQRQEAERKIQEQAALLDKARDAILLCDLGERIVYWNEGATRLYGWPPEAVMNQPYETLLFRKKPADWSAIRQVVNEAGEWIGELRQVTREGTEVIVRCRQTLVRDSAGQPASVLFINSDITEQKRIEAQFLRTQRMECIGALAGGIAHDLNNMLAPIMVAVDVIKNDPANEANRELLDLIGASAQRGSEMVKQILSFARGVSGGKTEMPPATIINEIVKLADDTFPSQIVVHSGVPDDLPRIHADATQFHQVVLNLCVNARDAMPNGGALTIKAAPVVLQNRVTPFHPAPLSGLFIEISVADTGVGIPPETLPRIFEPFFTTKDPGKGTGLGLSTVHGIVKGHDGFVEVETKAGRGTTFRVYLPAMDAPAAAGDLVQEPPLPQGRNERILVVDDEAAIVEITRETLGAFNYQVLTAGSGAEAIAVFARHHAEIDLVATDMIMPPMDGRALLKALRNIKPNIRIIAISGRAMDAATIEALGIGAFLRKPYTKIELLSAIRTVLDE